MNTKIDRLMSIILGIEEKPYQSSGQVDDAEERLNSPLPAALRIFYQKYGQHRHLLTVQDVFLDSTDVYTESDHLVICHDSQLAYKWGIAQGHLDTVNPPVDVMASDDKEWTQHYDSVNDFIVSFILWQSVNGGMSSRRFGVLRGDDQLRVIKIMNALLETNTSYTAGVQYWTGDDLIVGMITEESSTDIRIAFNSSATLDRLHESIGTLKYLR